MKLLNIYFLNFFLKRQKVERVFRQDIPRNYRFSTNKKNLTDPQLWNRLEAFDFETRLVGQASVTSPTDQFDRFAMYNKLAEQEDWSINYSLAAFEEYRRFLYLAQIAGFEVTPSTIVDRVWHTHLIYSKEYWELLCREVLNRPLRHEPCLGSEAMPRYAENYQKTKDLYLSEFGQSPPLNIWPSSVDTIKYVRLKTRRDKFSPIVAIAVAIVVSALMPLLALALALPTVWFSLLVYQDSLSVRMAEIGPEKSVAWRSGGEMGQCGVAGCGGCGGCGGI